MTNRSGPETADFYRSIWRWHFYAGLIVLPFLAILAVTGALYLFNNELDGLVHADLKRIEASGVPLRASALVAAATSAYPGTATRLITPADNPASSEVQVTSASGEKLSVYVDPYRGEVLGTLPQGGTVMGVVRKIHSLAFFGTIANAVMEIAAGWAILLVLTGIYLWWPRGSADGVVTVRGKPKHRMWWRDVHAVTGAFAGIFVVFLALSGMPWSVFWGDRFGSFVDARGLGVPEGVWYGEPKSDVKLADLGPAAWTVERTNVPVSAARQGGFTLDQAVATFEGLGLSRGYAVALPTTPDGVFTGSVFPDDVSLQRTVHLDRYSGAVLQDIGYAQYGPVGKLTEWGISVHMGQEFGLANRLLMLTACLAILILCVSAAVMWWKRRPSGALGVPPMPRDRQRLRIATALLITGGALFPLTGLSFLILVLADWAVTGRRPAPG